MKPEEVSFKDLTKMQLDSLKDLYINSRVNSMSEVDLRKFVKEVLDLQVRGTVGNEEEKEVWKEMKDHFDDNFRSMLQEVIKLKGSEEVSFSQEEEDLKDRQRVLEERQKEESQKNQDMW